jgi:hypothetical protein
MDSHLALPNGRPTSAVLVLAGSSGRVDRDRADLLAGHGAAALAIQWFEGSLSEVPLEIFDEPLNDLLKLSEHLVVMGLSKGAEAALLLARQDDRIKAVIGTTPDRRGPEAISHCPKSGTTGRGQRPGFRTPYEQSLHAFPDEGAAAGIPVERIKGDVLVTPGGNDQMWPSDLSAQRIKPRRSRPAPCRR